MSQQLVNSEPTDPEVIEELDISHLTLEDDTPVDNFQSAQQQRLLVDGLYGNDYLSRPFIAEANVGVFYKLYGEPVVPDMLLSLGIQRAEDFSQRRDRAYFVWEFGKVPEVCIEVISNREGNELRPSSKSQRRGKVASKKDIYARIGVPYYAVFDPLRRLQDETDMNGALLRVWHLVSGQYVELTPETGIAAVGQPVLLETLGLGLTLWEGPYEEAISRQWLRWCDPQGRVLPTGAEGQATERQRADTERQRADTERQRADTERQRADTERQRADTERQRAERLAARLKQLGVDLDEI